MVISREDFIKENIKEMYDIFPISLSIAQKALSDMKVKIFFLCVSISIFIHPKLMSCDDLIMLSHQTTIYLFDIFYGSQTHRLSDGTAATPST